VKSIAYLTMFTRSEPSLLRFCWLLNRSAGWRSVFYFVTAIGFLIALLAYLVVPETGKAYCAYRRAFRDYRVFRFAPLSALLRPRVTPAAPRAPSMDRGQCIVFPDEGGAASVATEFGLYFAMIPSARAGTVIASRIGSRASVERMILIEAASR